jgi:hypothetical protein
MIMDNNGLPQVLIERAETVGGLENGFPLPHTRVKVDIIGLFT